MWRQDGTLVVLFCLVQGYLFDCLVDSEKLWRQNGTLVVLFRLVEDY